MELFYQLFSYTPLDFVDLFVRERAIHVAVIDTVRVRYFAGLFVRELIEQLDILHQITSDSANQL